MSLVVFMKEELLAGKQINYREMIKFSCFVSLVEPKDIKTALEDEFWFEACHEEQN